MVDYITIIGPDDFTRCPVCQRRVDINDTVIAEDEDGPIYEAECPDHGKFRWQVIDD